MRPHQKSITKYRSIEIDYTQTFFLGEINYQLQIQNRAARRTNFHCRDRSVDSWQRISHYRYRFSLEFQLITIADTDFRPKTNEFSNNFGYDSTPAFGGPPCTWAKRGRFVLFPVLCLLAYGDTTLKSSFTSIWGAQKQV